MFTRVVHRQFSSSAACASERVSKRSGLLKTLNVSDIPWPYPGCAPLVGSIGHVRPFEEACALASAHGFDAVNLDMDYLRANGPRAVKECLEKYGLEPGCYRFPVQLTDEVARVFTPITHARAKQNLAS